MATITANITADQDVIAVSGDVSVAVTKVGYRIDDEIVTLRAFGQTDAWSPRPQTNRAIWVVTRGAEGTTRATHLAGAAIVAVAEAVATGESLTPPAPFAGTGSGGVTVDNGTDPPAAVTTLVASGATIDGAEATLPVALYKVTVTLTDAEVKALNSTHIVLVPATEVLDYVGTPNSVPIPVSMTAAIRKPTFEGYDDAAGTALLKFALGDLDDGVAFSEEPPGFLEVSGGAEDLRLKTFRHLVGNNVEYGLGDGFLVDNALRFGASADNPFTGGNAANVLTLTVVYFNLDTSG